MPHGRFDPRRQSLAHRVTALAAVAVGLAVAALSAAAYFTVRHELYASLDHSLINRATAAARSDVISDLTNQSIPSWMIGAADVRIGFITADNEVVTADRGLDQTQLELGQPELDVAQGRLTESVRTIVTDDGSFRVAAVPTRDGGEALVLAQSLSATEETLARLGMVLIFLGAFGVLSAAFGGWLVARNGLKPLRVLTEAMEEVSHTEALDPIPVRGDDEIARVAAAFNSVLASLAASRDLQRQLIADASHELRTPLTSLRTNLDLLLQAEHGEGLDWKQRRELMDDVAFQIGEMTELIGDLTELARDERLPTEGDAVDLGDIIERAVDRVQRRGNGITFEVTTEPWTVIGEETALERAVSNLLDNAAKWSPPLGSVEVTLRGGWISVADEGPGIAETDAAHVFDRFYRARESRGLPGSGLGLSIVKHVAERHGGAVAVGRSEAGGALFTMFIPGSPGHGPLTAGGSSVHSGPSDNGTKVTA